MQYVKQNWEDFVSPNSSTPITADRMNHIEDGLKDLVDDYHYVQSNKTTSVHVQSFNYVYNGDSLSCGCTKTITIPFSIPSEFVPVYFQSLESNCAIRSYEITNTEITISVVNDMASKELIPCISGKVIAVKEYRASKPDAYVRTVWKDATPDEYVSNQLRYYNLNKIEQGLNSISTTVNMMKNSELYQDCVSLDVTQFSKSRSDIFLDAGSGATVYCSMSIMNLSPGYVTLIGLPKIETRSALSGLYWTNGAFGVQQYNAHNAVSYYPYASGKSCFVPNQDYDITYSRNTWVDLPLSYTPISAQRLNKIETAISVNTRYMKDFLAIGMQTDIPFESIEFKPFVSHSLISYAIIIDSSYTPVFLEFDTDAKLEVLGWEMTNSKVSITVMNASDTAVNVEVKLRVTSIKTS